MWVMERVLKSTESWNA